MSWRAIAVGILAVFVVILLVALGYLIISSPEELVAGTQEVRESFLLKEFSVAGNSGYAFYSYKGEGNITLLSLSSKPQKRVFLVNDSQAIDNSRLPELEAELRMLERYGYEIMVVDTTAQGSGIYVVPSGALPASMLSKIKNNFTNGAIFYIGEKDLILSKGIKRMDWYSSLTNSERQNLIVYNGTLDDYLENESRPLVYEILYETWNQQANSTTGLSGDGLYSSTVEMKDSSYLRLIYDFSTIAGMSDSGSLSFDGLVLTPSPVSVFPWQKSDLRYTLGRTNGTAYLSIMKDGREVFSKTLGRVTDENVFVERLSFEESGNYLINVSDNSGIIASGILHVKDLDIQLIDQMGVTYVFSVTVDGQPVHNVDALVWLGDSESRSKFYVTDGVLVVRAQPDPGITVFNIQLLGTTIPVDIETRASNLFDFYLKYGIPVLLIVAAVYFGTKLSRSPVYTLRFGESGNIVRQEVQLSTPEVLDIFKRARDDLHLGTMPLTPQEYTIALRRHITNGADVTEGNVEAILKQLVKKGLLQNHREYYQLSSEGDPKINALRRMVKERLIENGVMYKESGDKFITKDHEIGFFGAKFKKKGIIVVDDESEKKRILQSLSPEERVKLRLLQANDIIRFIAIDKLSDVL